MKIRIDRLTADNLPLARQVFFTIAEVFETQGAPLRDPYLHRLLARPDFWALAAIVDDEVAGGLTAFTLPLTRAEESEVFLYDIAVRPAYRRRGVGRRLIQALLDGMAAEGIHAMFVPADNEDEEALDFYRALGGAAQPVTIFNFPAE